MNSAAHNEIFILCGGGVGRTWQSLGESRQEGRKIEIPLSTVGPPPSSCRGYRVGRLRPSNAPPPHHHFHSLPLLQLSSPLLFSPKKQEAVSATYLRQNADAMMVMLIQQVFPQPVAPSPAPPHYPGRLPTFPVEPIPGDFLPAAVLALS